MPSKLPPLAFSALLLAGSVLPLHAVMWTVTTGNEGHTVVDPDNAHPGVVSVLSEAKAYLDAHTSSNLVLFFPGRTYQFNPDATGIFASGFVNGTLTLRGGNGAAATILQFNALNRVGLWVKDSNHVTVERLTLVRPGYFSTQFDVVGTNATCAVLEVHSGFPSPLDLMAYNGWQGQEVTLFPFRYIDGQPITNPCSPKRLLRQPANETDTVTPDTTPYDNTGLPAGQYHAYFKTPGLPAWGPGDMVAAKFRSGQNSLRFDNSDDCVARNVTITNFCGNPIRTFNDTDRLLLDRVKVLRPPGGIGGRIPFFSGSDGGIQLTSGAFGPTVVNCTVESTADDAIGIFTNNSSLPTSGVLIEDNTIIDGQARGILITQSVNGTCRNNRFYRNNAWSVAIYGDNPVSQWLITNNTFTQSWSEPVIGFATVNGTGQLFDHINISNNTFVEAPRNNHVVYVDLAGNVTIDHNTIESFSPEEDYSPDGTADALVFVASALNVQGTGNTWLTPSKRQPLLVKPGNNGTCSVEWTGPAGGDTFSPVADAFVQQNAPDTNFGSSSFLRVRGNTTSFEFQTFLKFELADIPLPVTSAKLRLYSDDLDMNATCHTTESGWTESKLTWNNRTALGAALDTRDADPGKWVEFDVTPYVTGNGTYSFALTGDANNASQDFLSREYGAPQLVVTYDPYAAWASWHGLSGNDTDPASNPAGDGVINLWKFSSNLDPTAPDRRLVELDSGNSGLPHWIVEGTGPDAILRVEFLRRTDDPSLAYDVEFSSDLQNWNPATGPETVTVLNDTWERSVVYDSVNAGSAGRRFARVRATLAP